MSAHTPGPWRVKSDKWVIASRGEHEGEILIAPTYWMENVPEEAAANARLIAAAPMLLEELQRLVRVAQRVVDRHDDRERMTRVLWADLNAVIQDARYVIANASDDHA